MKKFDKELFEKYPYAFSHYAWTGEICGDPNAENEEDKPFCESENLPKGWEKLFWLCMEDIKEPLEKAGLLNKFYLTQVKEKYGTMRLYNNGATQEINDILTKYEYLSSFVCQNCGKPAKYQTQGWISNLCADCLKHEPSDVEIVKFESIMKFKRYFGDHTEEIVWDVSDIWNRLYGKTND